MAAPNFSCRMPTRSISHDAAMRVGYADCLDGLWPPAGYGRPLHERGDANAEGGEGVAALIRRRGRASMAGCQGA